MLDTYNVIIITTVYLEKTTVFIDLTQTFIHVLILYNSVDETINSPTVAKKDIKRCHIHTAK